MTFTYSGDPSTSTRNYVRFLIHDTDSTDALFSDEELNYVITEWGNDAYKAARECAEILIARFSRLADSSSKSVGDISVSESFTSKITHYKELANSLLSREMRKSPPRPFANAQSLKSTNDRIVDDYNTDAYTGIHDNPNNVYDHRIVEQGQPMDAIYAKVAEFMTDSVVFTAKASVDKYNKPTFANSNTTVTGRLIYDTVKSKDVQGVEVVDIGRFITYGPATSITVGHRMVVGADTFTINGVDNIADENGAHHTVIRFGRQPMAKSSFTLDLFGDKELVNALKAGEEDTPQAIAQAIWEEANVIFAKSQVLVPVDTGVLRGSGGVSSPQMGTAGYFVDVFYGGPAAPYALFVHEIIGNYHNPPTQAKYLEQPVMEAMSTIQENIKSRIIDIIKKGHRG